MDRQRDDTVYDNAPDAIVIMDTVGVVQYVNLPAVQLLELSHIGACGNSIQEILKLHNGATDQPITAPLTYLMSLDAAHTLAANNSVQIVRHDGTKIAITCSVNTIHSSRHWPGGLILTLRATNGIHASNE